MLCVRWLVSEVNKFLTGLFDILILLKLLEELCLMGRDPRFICTRPQAKPEYGISALTRVLKDAGSSDDEEEDEEDTGASPVQGPLTKSQPERGVGDSIFSSGAKTAVPLVDYILNVVCNFFHIYLLYK